jgi:hypothetical protein
MGNCVFGSCYNKEEHTIVCDKAGIIVTVSKALLQKLNYTSETLQGKFIGILMDDFMSILHKDKFIPTFNNSSGAKREYFSNKLAWHSKGPLVIYDKDDNGYYVAAFIDHRDSKFMIKFIFEFIAPSFKRKITSKPVLSFVV